MVSLLLQILELGTDRLSNRDDKVSELQEIKRQIVEKFVI